MSGPSGVGTTGVLACTVEVLLAPSSPNWLINQGPSVTHSKLNSFLYVMGYQEWHIVWFYIHMSPIFMHISFNLVYYLYIYIWVKHLNSFNSVRCWLVSCKKIPLYLVRYDIVIMVMLYCLAWTQMPPSISICTFMAKREKKAKELWSFGKYNNKFKVSTFVKELHRNCRDKGETTLKLWGLKRQCVREISL
jgi:hypothetical protein